MADKVAFLTNLSRREFAPTWGNHRNRSSLN
jgi:hypothetical protein